MVTAIGSDGAVAATPTFVAPLFAHKIDVSNFASGVDFAIALQPLLGPTGATLFPLDIPAVAARTISTSTTHDRSKW
jgi:hypothetical protein